MQVRRNRPTALREGFVKRVAKWLFGISAALLIALVFFITDTGQVILRGKVPANVSPERLDDDIYMGAALAPYAYLLVPAVILLFFGILHWAVAARKKRLTDKR